MSRGGRKAMIRRDRPALGLSRQCEILSISCPSIHDAPKGESGERLSLMRRIEEVFLQHPFCGRSQMARQVRRDGACVSRHRVPRLMRLMGLDGHSSGAGNRRSPSGARDSSTPAQGLDDLKGLTIERPDHLWCADMTGIPVQRGVLHQVAGHGLREASRARLAPGEHHGFHLLRVPSSASRR